MDFPPGCSLSLSLCLCLGGLSVTLPTRVVLNIFQSPACLRFLQRFESRKPVLDPEAHEARAGNLLLQHVVIRTAHLWPPMSFTGADLKAAAVHLRSAIFLARSSRAGGEICHGRSKREELLTNYYLLLLSHTFNVSGHLSVGTTLETKAFCIVAMMKQTSTNKPGVELFRRTALLLCSHTFYESTAAECVQKSHFARLDPGSGIRTVVNPAAGAAETHTHTYPHSARVDGSRPCILKEQGASFLLATAWALRASQARRNVQARASKLLGDRPHLHMLSRSFHPTIGSDPSIKLPARI